jgi:hypothetical protein
MYSFPVSPVDGSAPPTARDRNNANSDDNVINKSFSATIFDRAQMGIFGVMHILNKYRHTGFSSVLMYLILESLQLWYFAFTPDVFPWHPQVANVLRSSTSIINFSFLHDNADLFWGSIIIIIIVIVVTVSHAIYIGYAFSKGQVKMAWSFWLLRYTARLFIGILFLPIISTLLNVFSCNENGYHNSATTTACWTVEHTIVVGVSTFVGLLFVVFTGLTALMFVDRDPLSHCYRAASTGRVNCTVLAIKCIIVSAFAVSTNPTFLSCVLIGSSSALFGTFLYFLPFYHKATNTAHVLCYASFWWASVCAAISVLINDEDDLSAGMLFLVSLVPVLFSFSALVDMRKESIEQSLNLASQWLVAPHLNGIVQAEETFDSELFEFKVAKLLEQFPTSVAIRLFASSAWDAHGSPVFASSQIKECEDFGNLPIDYAFVVYSRNRMQEENSRNFSINLDATSLIKIENHEYEMECNIQLCHLSVINFWEEIASPKAADFAKYTAISSEIHTHATTAEEHFRECVQLQPSPSIFHRFSMFTMYTMNNKWRAEEFTKVCYERTHGLLLECL